MIVLLEGVLKIVDYPKIPVSGWYHWPGIEDTNQLGHRGRYIDYSPDAFVVLLVGDSQVECVVCADLVIHGRLWVMMFGTIFFLLMILRA